MLDTLARNWWAFAIRGVAAVIFGILAILWPHLTLAVLIAIFGVYALIDGISLLVSLVRGEPGARRPAWAIAVDGVIGIVAGIIALLLPGITALTLVYVVAIWAILIGVFQVIGAIRLRREIHNEVWMAIGGIIAILFGVYLAVFPGAGLLSLVWFVGIWAIVFGISSLVLAFRLRGHAQTIRGAAWT